MSWKPCKIDSTAPAIMESLNSMSFESLFRQNFVTADGSRTKSLNDDNNESFLLLDEQGKLKVFNSNEFLQKLDCIGKNIKVKVVSIFGNTGDGKSHTMNQTFFKGKEIFKTSNEQSSCTLGVWAAFDPLLNVICLDTEGLQGIPNYQSVHTRLLVKVLAISDIVIYRIQSERLNRDLFTFLGTASRAYNYHFKAALEARGQQEGISSTLGPSIIVLHETRHTIPLTNNGLESAEDILRKIFAQKQLEIDAFSFIKYVGLQTMNNAMDYKQLRSAIKSELNNTTIRSARKPHIVYNTLKTLNDISSSELEHFSNTLFPNQYFSCSVKCLSCGNRCNNSMGHTNEGKPHDNNNRCRYQRQYENLIYICKECYKNGNEVEVHKQWQEQDEPSWYNLAKSAWSGYNIDCPHCGEIYRSRQYWYGNKNPEEVAIRKKITHVWNTSNRSVASQNTAQRVIDGVTYITEAVSNVSLQPTKALTAWVTDQVAPSYWRPNHDIKYCLKCKSIFGPTDTKHHCRECGEGFCAQCSSKTKCVPSKKWYTPVRVCDNCYNKEINHSNDDLIENAEDVNARKVTEHVVSTFNAVGNVLNYSKALIKDSVRPSYWIPDSEIVDCYVCTRKFSETLLIHHCRECGRGVCQECSPNRKPVPHRGWDKPVRVCNSCIKTD